MSNQKRELSEVTTVPNNTEIQDNGNNQVSNADKQIEKSNTNERSSSEYVNSNDLTVSNEQETTVRITMPQDIRYSTEKGDQEKLMEKYNSYQVSDKNSCNIRFLIDHRQKRNLLGRNEEENSNLHCIGKAFNVNISPSYQNPTKVSFKMFGTEASVRKCLIDIVSRMYEHVNRSITQGDNEKSDQQTTLANVEKSYETEVSISEHDKRSDDKCPSHPTSSVSTANYSDTSSGEEEKLITPSTLNISDEKPNTKDENTEQELLQYIPLERKPEYTFVILITSQGQEVLKKNWSFFAGSLQQRLNVTVTNPLKLPKFGDKQWQNELSITGDLYENIIDAAIQITAFINDVLGVPTQLYQNEEQMNDDYSNSQRTKSSNNNNNDYYQQHRNEYNAGYRQSTAQHQGQSSPLNYHERIFFNRGRNGAFEQIILIRSNCVARIVGTRGSNLRRIQSKCHLRDIVVARHPDENGYVECTLSAYQARNLNFAIDSIRNHLRNEDDQAVQVLDPHYVDIPLQSPSFQDSPQNDQPRLSFPYQNFEHFHRPTSSTNHYQQQSTRPFTTPSFLSQMHRETGFMTRSLHLGNGNQLPQSSYNFQNTPSFDFTHQPTSASRKTDKRPGEVNDFNNANISQIRTSNDHQYQQSVGSSSSNSSSVSPRHKSKRTCPETKEIDCTTDDGFWIHKQYYHALDDASKELFDSLLDKLEKIRIVSEENAARKQQRLVGRNRSNKSRGFTSSISTATQSNEEKDLTIKSTNDTQDDKIQESANIGEEKATNEFTEIEQNTNAAVVNQK